MSDKREPAFIDVAAWFWDTFAEHMTRVSAEMKARYPQFPTLTVDAVTICALTDGTEGLMLKHSHVESVDRTQPGFDLLINAQAKRLAQYGADE